MVAIVQPRNHPSSGKLLQPNMQMPIYQPNKSATPAHYQLVFHLTPQSQNLNP